MNGLNSEAEVSGTKTYLALSVVAPAGDQIRAGQKRLEIRKWKPDVLPLRDLLIVQNQQRLSRTGMSEDPAGTVVALVDVVAVREWREDDLTAACATRWTPGWVAWELVNVRPVDHTRFVPARRRLYELELRPPVAPGLPAPSPDGHRVIMLRPDLKNIPAAPFPEGYGIRPMTTDDIGLWTDIQRDAESYFKIADTLFRQEFGEDLEAIQSRCFILTNPKGLGVGTISAWYDNNFHGQRIGRIHWVSVRPSCQRRGLSKAALAYSLKQLAQWHDRCYLVTATARVPAINLYLNFGFVPNLSLPNAAAIWQELSPRLKHPALNL